MRILKPFGISKGTDSGLSVAPQQVSEVPTLSKSECCKIVLEEAAKKQKQLADHRKQFKKEYREKQKEYQEHKKEYKEHKREYKEFKKEYREHKKEYRRKQRQHYSENFDSYLVEQIGCGGGSSYHYAGPLSQPDPPKHVMCPIEKQRLKSQNLTASWSISSVDSRNKSSNHCKTGDEDSRSTFNNDSKLRFGKISLLPATKVKNKLNQYRIALSPSSSNPKLYSNNNLPELRRMTSQSSLETITDAKQRKSKTISLQSSSSTSSSITKYEISDSTLNAADSTADELAESLCSLETGSLTDKSLSSVVSSDLSVYSHSSSSASSFSVQSNNFNQADSETSSINHDFIEFNRRFEVMHNLNPTIPIQHQRLTALNNVLPDRLNSMTESVSTFSTGSEIEFSDIETYQTRRTNSSERDEEDDVKIVVRGEEPD